MMPMTIGDLRASELQKLGEGSPDADELDLAMQFDQCNDALRAATEKYANLYSRMVGTLSPQAKASADVLGIKLNKEIGALENCSIEIQKRLIGVRKTRSHATLSKGFDEAARDLATLKEHMAIINTGTVRVDEAVRRRLVNAITVAELRIQQSA